MSRFRLSSEPSVTALVLDVLVLWITLPSAFATGLPAWVRLIFGVVALLAAVLGVRSAILLHRRSRRGSAAETERGPDHDQPAVSPHVDSEPSEVAVERPMPFVLAVWEGPRPTNSDEAGETLDRLMDADDERVDGAPARPLAPGVDAFLTDLLGRWPDLGRSAGESSPWAMSAIRERASGELLLLSLRNSPELDEVVHHIAALARKHGLVCYDPEVETVIS